MPAEPRPPPQRVLRFGGTERAIHASFAALFLVLLATGLIQWIPALSVTIGNRHAVREVHLLSGLALIGVPACIALVGDHTAVRRAARELTHFDRDDRAFLTGQPSEPGRFNGGQKSNSIWTASSTVLFLASGIVQWQWTRFDPSWRTGAARVHDLLTVVAVVVLVGHLYLALVHPTTRPTLRGIVTGRVPAAWAATKHPRWELEPGTPADEEGARPTGRRLFLVGSGAGLAAIVTGGRWLPRIVLPSSSGWRIYNVAGAIPDPEGFRLRVDGLVDRPLELDLRDLVALPGVQQVNDFECVTGWKVDDVRWEGVRVSTLLDEAGIRPDASHVTFRSRDGVYTDSLALADAKHPETLLALRMNGEALPTRHGGPARLVVPSMYGYKSVKWVGSLELADHEHIGYWERRGYSRDARIDTSGKTPVYAGERVTLPVLGVSVLVPHGWGVEELPGGGALITAVRERPERVEASIITSPSTVTATRHMTHSMLAELERAGLTETRYGAISADGLTADTLSASDGSGQRFLFAFFPDGGRVVQVQGQGPARDWSRWGPVFEQLAASLERPA